MKKQVLFIMFLLLTIVGTAKATEVEISLQQIFASSEGKRNNQKGGIRHAPPVHPQQPIVTIDGNSITVRFLSNGAILTLAMYDGEGNVIYNMTTTATASTWSTNIPNDIIDNITSLRLVVNGKMYIGEL